MAKINLDVIDQFYAAQMSMNESEETLKALRPQDKVFINNRLIELSNPMPFGRHIVVIRVPHQVRNVV